MFTGIGLAGRRDVGMGNDPAGRNGVAGKDAVTEGDDGVDLDVGIGGKRAVRQRHVMAAIDDLDADGARIQVVVALPAGDAGMPGALVLADKLGDAAILPDHVMGRDF